MLDLLFVRFEGEEDHIQLHSPKLSKKFDLQEVHERVWKWP